MKNSIYYIVPLILCASFLTGYAFNASMFFVAPKNPVHAMYAEKESILTFYSENPGFQLPDTSFQQVLTRQSEAKGSRVTVRTGMTRQRPLTKTARKALLANTRMLSLDSPYIRKIAQTIRTKRQPLKATEQFVYDYITDKTVGIPLVSAESILKMKAGDCTEHTVLAVAILRKARIPARALVGIILAPNFEGHTDVFVFHMWAEAYWNGKWQLVDATSPQKKYYNRYIAFSTHSLKTPMPLHLTETLAAIKNLEIRYTP
jgi:transglutaminase-like putative cysteine protease